MKKDTEKLEKFWGGVFGVVAIAAAIISLVLGEIDGSSVWGCVKDVAGTIVVVMVLFASLPKFPKNFKEAFINAMEEIIEKYNPLISADRKFDKSNAEENDKKDGMPISPDKKSDEPDAEENANKDGTLVSANKKSNKSDAGKKHDIIRYCIANNTNCIFNENPGKPYRFFDFDFTDNSIQFYVSKGIFIEDSNTQIINIEDIKSKFIQKLMAYSEIANAASNKDGIKVSFKEKLSTHNDVNALKKMIDEMVFYYMAQSKKGEKINKNAN